jgi:hypothetical protein
MVNHAEKWLAHIQTLEDTLGAAVDDQCCVMVPIGEMRAIIGSALESAALKSEVDQTLHGWCLAEQAVARCVAERDELAKQVELLSARQTTIKGDE